MCVVKCKERTQEIQNRDKDIPPIFKLFLKMRFFFFLMQKETCDPYKILEIVKETKAKSIELIQISNSPEFAKEKGFLLARKAVSHLSII